MKDLTSFGWTDKQTAQWQALETTGLVPARVVADFGTSLKIATPTIITAELSGKLAHYTERTATPKIGDWVAVRLMDSGNAVIETVLPRHSEIVRKAAGTQTTKQIIAANVDIAFVLLALDSDFSIERLKRFLYQLSVAAIEPVIVLNKADKVADPQPYIDALHDLAVPVIVATATQGTGIQDITAHIRPGQTAVLMGSSGVGKSTLTNQLLGREVQATQAIRASDETGRHTTVHRELFVLPGGGLLIDMPGIRELQLWGTTEDLDDNFEDIAVLISQCIYTTCQHKDEPGCAIRAALQSGALSATHYANYRKMKLELELLQQRNVVKAKRANQKSRKKIARQTDDMLDGDW